MSPDSKAPSQDSAAWEVDAAVTSVAPNSRSRAKAQANTQAQAQGRARRGSRACVALDGTGGDNQNTRAVVDAVRFAMAMYPQLDLIIFGSSQLEHDLAKAGIKEDRYQFRMAQQTIPQDECPRDVLKYYRNAAMVQAMLSVQSGEADSMISSGGTGPLVCVARHILGVQHLSERRMEHKERIAMQLGLSAKGAAAFIRGGAVRPCFSARIPVGPQRFALMLDLGANATCTPSGLYDFACLGSECAKISLELPSPRVAILNVGTELGKGNALVQQAREYIEQDRSLQYVGFIEGNRIFRNDADVIVTDGFTGNVALKAAEGVADIYGSSGGMKRFFSKMARPEWLLPWQYNGSVLLGVNGVVVKSHASAGVEAFAVAVVEAARAAQASLAENMQRRLSKD